MEISNLKSQAWGSSLDNYKAQTGAAAATAEHSWPLGGGGGSPLNFWFYPGTIKADFNPRPPSILFFGPYPFKKTLWPCMLLKFK
jgi:hypothetical protein